MYRAFLYIYLWITHHKIQWILFQPDNLSDQYAPILLLTSESEYKERSFIVFAIKWLFFRSWNRSPARLEIGTSSKINSPTWRALHCGQINCTKGKYRLTIVPLKTRFLCLQRYKSDSFHWYLQWIWFRLSFL